MLTRSHDFLFCPLHASNFKPFFCGSFQTFDQTQTVDHSKPQPLITPLIIPCAQVESPDLASLDLDLRTFHPAAGLPGRLGLLTKRLRLRCAVDRPNTDVDRGEALKLGAVLG